MNEEEIEKKAKEVYPEHEFGLYIKENELKREGYTKALTELEFMPKIKGWVARDEVGELWLCNHKPYISEGILCGKQFILRLDEFDNLKFGDEPVKIELILRKS